MTPRAERLSRAITVPARPDQLAPLRDRIGRWLADSDIPPPLRSDIVLATDEALANSVEHAYRHQEESGTVDVTVTVNQDEVAVSVTDHGSWKQPCPERCEFRGRGLRIIRSLAERVDVDHTAEGTGLIAHFPRHA